MSGDTTVARFDGGICEGVGSDANAAVGADSSIGVGAEDSIDFGAFAAADWRSDASIAFSTILKTFITFCTLSLSFLTLLRVCRDTRHKFGLWG